MPDYKAMYYHLAGQMSVAIDALEGLVAITERLKKAQQVTEEMFLSDADDDSDGSDALHPVSGETAAAGSPCSSNGSGALRTLPGGGE